MATIPLTAREPRRFTPPTLEKRYEESIEAKPRKKGAPPRPLFFLAVPTLAERETINELMFELGVIQVSRDTIRNATLEAAIEIFGEEDALWLETHWQQTDLYEQYLAVWEEQEQQRQLDLIVSPRTALKEPAPLPASLTSLKDRLKAKRVVDQIITSDQNTRSLVARQLRYGREYDVMMLRVHLRGWEGLETPREANGGGEMPDIVTQECIAALREEIGADAFNELRNEIAGQYALSRAEVGNSVSPPGSGSPNTGSTQDLVAASGNSDGTSTETSSSSDRTPEPESAQTTEAL